MCCRGSTGNKWWWEWPGKLSASQAVWLFTFIVIIFTIHGCSSNQAPWFGRDRSLPRAPISVLTGPIDWQAGIRGVLELQMPKAEVEKHLGKPLVEAMSAEEALQHGLDPEDVMNYFYGGVFAWVEYDASGKVLSIEFDLRSLEQRMEIKQSLLLLIRGKSLLVSRQTDREAIVRFMQSIGQTTLEQQPYAIVVRFEGSGVLSVGFDGSQHVESVAIIY